MVVAAPAPAVRRTTAIGVEARRERRASLAAYGFVAPAMALLFVFNVIPLVQGILLSLQEWDGVSPTSSFVGVANYARAFTDDAFRASLLNALAFGAVGLLGGGTVGLVMALAVNARPRGAQAFRAIFFLPWILSVVVVGFLWVWLLDPAVGPINKALYGQNLGDWAHAWLAEPETAFPSVAAIYVWAHWGIGFLLFLSGLQNVPRDVLEASAIDGAGSWDRFRYIIWPLLLPISVVVSVLTLLLALQIFGTILVTTNGGPGFHTEVPTLRIYKESFQFFRFGLAAAMSIIFGVILIVVSLGQLWLSRRFSAE